MRRRTVILLAIAVAVAAGASASGGMPAKDRKPPTAPKIVGPSKTESPFPVYSFVSRDEVTPRAKLRYRCAFDSTRLRSCRSRYNEKLAPGLHVLRAQAVDLAGNRSRVSVRRIEVLAPPPPLSEAELQAQLARVRAATARYHSVDAALADGYVSSGLCVFEPTGAMGVHFDNSALMADPAIELERPEQLMYEPTAAGFVLMGVEYFKRDADQNLQTSDDAPRLFGRRFDGPMIGHYGGMPTHYDLHVWLWRDNPLGLFQPFNPAVRCP